MFGWRFWMTAIVSALVGMTATLSILCLMEERCSPMDKARKLIERLAGEERFQ